MWEPSLGLSTGSWSPSAGGRSPKPWKPPWYKDVGFEGADKKGVCVMGQRQRQANVATG